MNKRRGLAVVETAGSITWFAMDACWMFGGTFPAVVLAVPTIALSLLVFRYAPRRWPSWLVSGAMAAWASMNVLWMTYDLHLIGWGLVAGKGFLVLGAALIIAATLVGRSEALRTVLTRFRRLRLRA